MTFERGDVLLVRFPNSDLTTFKKRPVLVVQADRLDTGLSQRIVASITSNLARTGSTRVVIRRLSPEGRAMGLLTDSVVMTDNLATILDREVEDYRPVPDYGSGEQRASDSPQIVVPPHGLNVNVPRIARRRGDQARAALPLDNVHSPSASAGGTARSLSGLTTIVTARMPSAAMSSVITAKGWPAR